MKNICTESLKKMFIRSDLMKQLGGVENANQELKTLEVNVNQLDKLLDDFKTEVQKTTIDYMKTKVIFFC
jgi:t-SNARE complex subunit (syntaxin)